MTTLSSILVPVDGSQFAEQAVGVAAVLARAAKAKVRVALAHQVPAAPRTGEAAKLYPKIELAMRRAERAYLNGLVTRLKEAGCRDVSRVLLTGRPAPALAEHAVEWGASLVVMSTHGRGPLQRAWLGSVADHLVRHLASPVLLIRPSQDEPSPAVDLSRPILVPLDGSSFGEAALAPAVDIARLLDAELRLIQIVRPVTDLTGVPMSFAAGYDERLTELSLDDAQRYLSKLAESLRETPLRATGTAMLREGVAGSILDLARSEKAGLIALATHGRGGVRRLTLGSVADKVVRGADCPVLVCPSKPRRA